MFDSRYKFTAKELDNETSYTYFGARYYDSDLSVWLSVDPMSDKRSWESPYSYCGNNPIIRIDNIGLIWDITELSEEQKKIWNNNIDEICSQSSLFKKMFDQLDKSDVVYKLKIGETQEDVPGQFNTNTITFLNEDLLNNFYVLGEEIFHAYQKDNEKLYEPNKSFNYEFEAKIGVVFMSYQQYLPTVINDNISEFVNFLMEKYGIYTVPNKEQINSSLFLDKYFECAEYFRQYNIKNNHGNSNYFFKTEQTPKSIIKLFE